MREPVVAGMFYAAQRDALSREIRGAFEHRIGPGRVPKPAARRAGRVKGIVVPHAGYRYSGATAAHAYAALADDGLPETVVLVGPDHRGGSLLATSPDDWRTPLGVARLDRELHDALLEAGPIVDDVRAHAREHSIEVQLPFVQFIAGEAERAPRFLPVAMGLQDGETARELADALAVAIAATHRDVVLVASSDLSHVGPDYLHDAPPGRTVAEHVRALDDKVIAAIETFDTRRVLDTVRRDDVPACGYGPIAAVLDAAKRLGATRARLLAKSTSWDAEEHASCVGYASFVIE